jgi:hypothetical protein
MPPYSAHPTQAFVWLASHISESCWAVRFEVSSGVREIGSMIPDPTRRTASAISLRERFNFSEDKAGDCGSGSVRGVMSNEAVGIVIGDRGDSVRDELEGLGMGKRYPSYIDK